MLLVFGALSLASVGAGCWVAGASGVPAGVWARDLVAWALGLAAAVLVARTAGRRAGAGFLLAGLVGLLATLPGPGLSGVHRWIQLGPLRVNAAELLLPPALVALAALAQGRWTWLLAAGIGAVLVAQPDASQATAFGGAVIAMLLLSPSGSVVRWSGLAVAAAAITVAWLRPDPLAPVPEVEEIFRLAWALSPVAALLAGIALVAAALAPAFVAREGSSPSRRAALALIVYFVISALAPVVGAFPTPLVGMGVSPILGWWLGAGLLAALASGRSTSSPAP